MKKDYLNILHVEDNSNSQLIFNYFLKGTPHRVDVAENGQIGFEKFVSGTYDLVFMDLEMPVMNGYDATRAMRNWESENRVGPVPIIAISAHDLETNEIEIRDSGFTAYYGKPIKKDRLLEALAKYGGNRENADPMNGI